MLQFDSVQCGMCKVATIQLHNPEPVPCKWSIKEQDQLKKKMKVQCQNGYSSCTVVIRTLDGNFSLFFGKLTTIIYVFLVVC